MANYKISQLPSSSAITSDDFLPIVDSGTLTTQRATAQQVLDYITGSTFNTLTASNLNSYRARVDHSLNTKSLTISGSSLVTVMQQDNSTRMSFDTTAQTFVFFKSAIATASFGAQAQLVELGGIGQLTKTNGNLFVSGSIYGQVAELTSSTTNYTFVASDSGKFINVNSGSAITVTVDSGLPAGFTVTVCQLGAGAVVFATGSGVTINNRQGHTRTAGQYAVASIVSTAYNTYVLVGDTTT